MSTRWFRSHDEVPAGVDSPFYAALIQEWVEYNHLPTSTRQLRHWQVLEPALAGPTSLAGLLALIDDSDPERTNQILAALVRLFHQDHYLAGRVLLQAFLPALSGRRFFTGTPGWRQTAVAEFWMALGEYPLARRPNKIAANLVLDTLKRCKADVIDDPREVIGNELVQGEQTRHSDDEYADPVADQATSTMDDRPGDDADAEHVIAWAVEHAIFTEADAQFVRAYNLDPTNADRSPRMRQKNSRLLRKLKTALEEQVLRNSS